MKTIRKILAAIIAVSLILGVMPIFSANIDGLENAILAVKGKIEIPDEYTEFDSEIRNGEQTEYFLAWNDKGYNSSVNVTINDRGDILNYYSHTAVLDDEQIHLAMFTEDELVGKAIEWLKKVNPSWIPELDTDNAYVPSGLNIYNNLSHIDFYRVKNGIRFLDNNVTVAVNNRTGEIVNMYSFWSYETDIPDPSEAMSIESAWEEYFKLSPLELEYEKIYDIGNLVYNPTNPYVRIDARKGGELPDRSSVYAADKEFGTTEEAAVSGGGSRNDMLSEAEISNLDEIEGLLSEDELVKIAKSLKNTNLDKAEYAECHYSRGYGYEKNYGDAGQKYYARINFSFNRNTANERTASVTLDASTGELIRFYAYDYSVYEGKDKNDKPEVSQDKAVNAAEEFIEEYSPEQAKNVKLTNGDDEVFEDYYFNFTRHENDIPYKADYVTVSVNSETGVITSFGKSWDYGIMFESPRGIVDNTAAVKSYRDNAELTLSYEYGYKLSADGKTSEKSVELCYRAECIKIEADTGEKTITEQTKTEVTDISGHYAEQQIKVLVDSGIIEISAENPVYRPDDIITKGELAQLVAKLKRRYTSYAEAEETARLMKIVLPDEIFNSDEQAQRIDGVTYIVRAIGYTEIAELSEIFSSSFSDAESIPADKTGYVAIARGFGIVRGDENGCFNAVHPLTRGDAAIMMYNYLVR